MCSFQYLATHDVLGDWSWCSGKRRAISGPLSARHRRCVRRSAGSQQDDSSWCYPAFTVNPDWTAFSVSKIPSITFFRPPNNVSRPPGVQPVAEGRFVESRCLHHASGRELVDHHFDEADLRRREALVGEEAGRRRSAPRRDPSPPCSEQSGPARPPGYGPGGPVNNVWPSSYRSPPGSSPIPVNRSR